MQISACFVRYWFGAKYEDDSSVTGRVLEASQIETNPTLLQHFYTCCLDSSTFFAKRTLICQTVSCMRLGGGGLTPCGLCLYSNELKLRAYFSPMAYSKRGFQDQLMF